jgi:hypothetical protein
VESVNSWLTHWEATWLLVVLLGELVVSSITLYWVIREYAYDENKDLEKNRKRTKTTKKTTRGKDGGETTEEVIETSEPMASNSSEGRDLSNKRERSDSGREEGKKG